ncbi:MAG: hypothetical protein CYG60_01610 [Actinobacteria bacterium]|nr:MAG: hypothetical protein CYG60_01610 [Actinomycetota bacterium]
MAVEPRSYREAIGIAIRGLRPHVEVAIVEPGVLAPEVVRLEPELVICGQPNTVTTTDRPAWVEYRPYDDWAEVCLDGNRSKLADVQLDDLISIVDEAEEVAGRKDDPGGC